MASIETQNILTDSFQARVTSMGSALYKSVTWYLDGSEWSNESLDTNDTSSSWVTFNNLRAGTRYKVTVEIYYETGTTDTVTKYITTESSGGSGTERPSYFEWDTAKTKGRAFKLTATEWNDLCSNINEVREYKGYSTKSFTRAYRGEDFTADMFNECLTAIYNINSNILDVCHAVSSGDVIKASYLNALRDYLNDVT